MKEQKQLVLLQCPCSCRFPIICPAEPGGERIACPWSGATFRVHSLTSAPPFGAEEWDACRSAVVLGLAVRETHDNISNRKWRLFACAVARAVLDWKSNYGHRLAVELGEALADGQRPPQSIQVVKNPAAPIWDPRAVSPHDELARRCIAETAESWPMSGLADVSDELVVSLLREFFPNPFVPLDWNPDWFTTTVRDLARHIDTARAFDSMPILADALQDAGCADEQILTHCRTDHPHARGCWVLDAVLRKP
jgi:hypothetical protein